MGPYSEAQRQLRHSQTPGRKESRGRRAGGEGSEDVKKVESVKQRTSAFCPLPGRAPAAPAALPSLPAARAACLAMFLSFPATARFSREARYLATSVPQSPSPRSGSRAPCLGCPAPAVPRSLAPPAGPARYGAAAEEAARRSPAAPVPHGARLARLLSCSSCFF